MVNTLLEKENIDISKATGDRETPLSAATPMGHNAIAAILKEKGAK
jgi:hypothetical protein